MSASHFPETNFDPSEREVVSGHLCRCTGYTGIVHAVLDAARRPREAAGDRKGGSRREKPGSASARRGDPMAVRS